MKIICYFVKYGKIGKISKETFYTNDTLLETIKDDFKKYELEKFNPKDCYYRVYAVYEDCSRLLIWSAKELYKKETK